MKKLVLLFSILIFSCSTNTKIVENKNKGLYEVLSQQSQGGASIQFYEILTEEAEIRMLLGDENLKNKISADDMKNSTVLILNMGEKPTGGFSITVEEVKEVSDKVIVTLKENIPPSGAMVTMALTNPYTVVKINSKKKIEIR